MTERETIGQKASAFFEDLWKGGDDQWNFESSEFEQAKYERQFELINDRRYDRALEIGCGSGCFTRLLADIADHVVAIDIAPSAITRARSLTSGRSTVEYRVANIWLIRTYRDLFVNVGFQIEREEIFRGIKNGVELDVLISVFGKGHGGQ